MGQIIFEVWIHAIPARDLEHVQSYIKGDAHDRSKISLFNGERFLQADELPAGEYDILAGVEFGTLVIKNTMEIR